MKRIHVLRHAKSDRGDPDLDDHDRPLSERGRRAADRLSRHCREAGVRPDVVVCSTALRARQTLRRLRPGLGPRARIVEDRSIYLGGVGAVLAAIRALDDAAETVMIVGHNPDLQSLILTLVAPRADAVLDRVRAKLPTCALATLECPADSWAKVARNSCRLTSLVTPRDLDPRRQDRPQGP